MKSVGIIQYGAGNIDSVVRAFDYCNGNPFIVNTAADLEKASHVVLPGVGSFTKAMNCLRQNGFEDELHENIIEKKKNLWEFV